ncbi:predicted protein [Naegleria gruberi]|uniref:Predicted protein n=1 Tax=Naegleria gruberi TaxID=5762 RepID=D2VL10_NAEGR|nr:uncharacterized protein NAEGRDRAFT_50439 [Naegleria gruberi]EFC42541.1 predicted protein [Naegleria gruberi]|eukprot:XP_002675285.1 predicted protein [Naegleria gruberi strain NEG-M]
MKNYIAVEGSNSRHYVQIRNPQAEVVISSYNTYYEPVTESMRIPNYDPTIRPWYKAGLKAPYPSYQWSTVFNNFFIKCLSLGAATTLDYDNYNMTQLSNGTYTKQSVVEIIGAHYDLYQLDYILNETIQANLDIQTKSIDIVIIERTGYLISTSMGYETRDANNNRVHMNQTTSVFSKISDYLMSQKIIIGPNGDMATLSSDNSTIILKIDQYRVSVQFIKDDHGLDWIIIQATVNYGFVKTVMTSDPALLSLSIIFIIFGTVLAMIVTQLITRSILKVSKDMSKISKLEVEEVKTSKLLKVVYELDLLQQSTKLVKNSLHSFMKYIPKDIVKDIVRNGIGAKLGVVNCSTSILFSDVADFTTFSESSTVSVLLKVLSEYFRIMTEAVESNGGVIDKFIGDGVMALFSHPLKQLDDHQNKSCQAALDALVAIEKLRIRCKAENWPDLRIRVGVNSGNAMIGNVGSKERFNYTAIGDSVNTAGRLETLNKRYETTVLIGQSTYEQAKTKFLCLFVDVVKLKGKSKPTEVYTLETEWSEANNIQKELHDSLIDIRDQLKSRQYENMIAKVDVLKCRISEWKTEAISMAASCEDENEHNDGPSICFSNLKFVDDLKERASNLKNVADSTTGERSFMDITLALNEK